MGMQVNWVDFFIVMVFGYHAYVGGNRGSLVLLANFGSYIGSLWMAIRFHSVVGNFIGETFGVSASWLDVLGYVAIAVVMQSIFESVFLYGVNMLPKKYVASKANHIIGSIISIFNTGILVSFFILLILALPIRGSLKQDVKNSYISQFFVTLSKRFGGGMQDSIEDIAKKTSKFFTVEPNSTQSISLDVPSYGVVYSIDNALENQMINLVNKERQSRNISSLTLDESIVDVAREKSRDMFLRRYFSHYDPDGKNAADRMNMARVPFELVGENLAYAPDLLSAHDGLMNSEGHRKNILDNRFHRIGIGVIDSAVYGKMFTQIFAD